VASTDGDLVVVRQQEGVASVDIVAALIEGIEPEATIKTFQQTTEGQPASNGPCHGERALPGKRRHAQRPCAVDSATRLNGSRE
jgi:hypothetical protein